MGDNIEKFRTVAINIDKTSLILDEIRNCMDFCILLYMRLPSLTAVTMVDDFYFMFGLHPCVNGISF